jgi:large subunit ribosomal protein L24
LLPRWSKRRAQEKMADFKTKLKRSDEVVVISGKEKGKRGKILRIDTGKGRVYVEGINMVKKALRKSQQNPNGGIAEVEGSLHISNVMAVDRRGNRQRVGYSLEKGEKNRIGRQSGEEL